jgi:hypothetical protein
MIPFRRLIWAIPVAYAVHVADQGATGFAGWFSTNFGGAMDPTAFALSTLGIMAVAVGLTAWTAMTMAKPLIVLLILWSSVHMIWDPLFHIGATVAQHRYSPGLASACLVCLPLGLWITAATVRQGLMSPRIMLVCNLAGIVLTLFMIQVGRHMPQLGAAF